MLIVIVVTAATALAAFVAGYQKEAQNQSALTHDRELEDLRVINVDPLPLPLVATSNSTGISGAPSLTVNAGTAGSVNGSWFTYPATIALKFGGESVTHCVSGSLVLGASGDFACVFPIPASVSGMVVVSASDGTNSVHLYVSVEQQTSLSVLEFTLASLYITSSIVTGISVNGQALSQYCVDPPSQPPPACVDSVMPAIGQTFPLASQQQVIVSANVTSDSPYNSSFFYTPMVLSGTSYLKVDVFTALGNDFAQSFVPPTAIAIVDSVETSNGAGFTTIPVLDGSQSIQPGNTTIVSWSWTVTNVTTSYVQVQSGEKVAEPEFVSSTAIAGDYSWSITLTVTNSDGLFGTATVAYPG